MDKLARIFRAESGQVLASLVCFCRDLQLAEDALQDAFEQANLTWPVQGMPDNCVAWLHLVAKRKLIDRLRKNQTHKLAEQDEQKIYVIEESLYPRIDGVAEQDYLVPDERLRLIFTCCHPALNEEAQVALTLRTLCGLNVQEIARAYLTSETTMARRISRAKTKIRDAGIAYQVPNDEHLESRLSSVLKVIYLIYNESYSAYQGLTLTRQGLANEAIRLSQVLVDLMPKAEVFGLAALLLFHDARRDSRICKSGLYTPLEDQDRQKWNRGFITQGNTLIEKALTYKQTGTYQIQAAISALHCNAKAWKETDWQQIYWLYTGLNRLTPSAVITLNQAVAQANIPQNNGENLATAYQVLLNLEDELQQYHPYHAARAELEVRLHLIEAAIFSLKTAITLSKNDSEQAFLQRKLKLIASGSAK